MSQSDEKLPADINVHRAIHPNFNLVDEGRPSSACLTPNQGDDFMLSISRGDKITAQEFHEIHTKNEDLKACGIFTFAHQLCIENGTPGLADPTPTNPAHAFLDFRHCDTMTRAIKLGRKLFKAAWQQNPEWSYRPS